MVASAAKPTDGDVIDQFLSAMRGNGIDIDEQIIADGKIHRYRAVGDRRNTRNAWAILHIDEHPAGKYGSWKTGETYTWQMSGGREISAEERRQMKAIARDRAHERKIETEKLQAEAQARAEWLYNNAQPVDIHPYLTAKGVQSNPRLRVGNWYYIDEDSGEEVLVASDALLVPLMDFTGKIHSLQAIMSDRDGGFRKQYLKNGAKEGFFLSLAKPTNNTVGIVEGLATGLSVQQCNDMAVLVAFDSGNLTHVAQALHEVKPDYRIVLCADNDQWTTKPVKNPGIHYARKAAGAVGGSVVYPEFKSIDTQPTDFNDLHKQEGADAVREVIKAHLAGPMRPPASPGMPSGVPPAGEDEPSQNSYFQILGHDHGTYYFRQLLTGEVLDYTISQMNDGGFIQLATLNWWQDKFPTGNNDSIDKKGAMEFIIRYAERRGPFSDEDRRGRGAWDDDGRYVYHHGDHLTVDGARVDDVTKFHSRFIYEKTRRLSFVTADREATDSEGLKLMSIATRFRWKMRGSAPLVLGWTALAPFCGILPWRPHIWITGNAGSGKSTVIGSFIHALLRDIALFAHGDSSGAGLRQELKFDARPVIMDEGEQNDESSARRMDGVQAGARQSSTDSAAKVLKGTVGGEALAFHARSMYCISSIQTGLKNQADIQRNAVLTLLPNDKSPIAAANWEALKEELHTTIVADKLMGARLFLRMLNLLPSILRTIEVFKSVAGKKFQNQRIGDQYGTLLAGCWHACGKEEATPESAAWFIDKYDWNDYIDESDNDESMNALSGLMNAKMDVGRGLKLSVYEVVSLAQNIFLKGVDDIDQAKAITLLARHGMKVDDDYLVISNTSNEFRSLLDKTIFKADWRGVILRLPGSDRNDNKPVRMNGVMVKVTRINLKSIFEGEYKRPTQTDVNDDLPAPF